MIQLEEIHGFTTSGEFNRFLEFVMKHVLAGEWQEVSVDPDYGPGELFGGRWFKVENGQIWRLLEPDFPFKGLWEPVDIGKMQAKGSH